VKLMPNIKRFILVTAKHLPQHKYFTKVAKSLATRFNVELEIKEEDYEFLSNYGDKDEFGMAWAPQLFVELDDGSIHVILSKLPIDTTSLKVDTNKAEELALESLRKLGVAVPDLPS